MLHLPKREVPSSRKIEESNPQPFTTGTAFKAAYPPLGAIFQRNSGRVFTANSTVVRSPLTWATEFQRPLWESNPPKTALQAVAYTQQAQWP